MYCPACGAKLLEDQKFCSECGKKIPARRPAPTQTPNLAKERQTYPNFEGYLNKYISKNTTYTSASSLMNGARPLYFEWVILCAICLLGAVFMGIGGVLVGILVSLIVIRFTLLFLLIKRGSKKYSTMGHNVDSDVLDRLTTFLEENLDACHFAGWQRGKPVNFAVFTADLLVVECLFDNKTYHRIVFDPDKAGEFKIEPPRAIVKERLKDGGDSNPSRCYKSDYIVRPILEAATRYFFRYVMRVK